MPFSNHLFLLFLLLLINTCAFGEEKLLLNGGWKFQYGDHYSWSQNQYDDSSWNSIKIPSLVKQLHKTPITGWYRLHFDFKSKTDHPQALLIDYIRHSDETWINGVRIGSEGQFEKIWHFEKTNPVGLIRLYDIPEKLLKPKNNVLAIKIGIGFGNALGAMFPGGAGILKGHVYIGNQKSLKKHQQQEIIKTSSIDLIFITLGIVDIFIILLLLKNALIIFPEFKWLLFTSFFMMLASVGHDFYYINGFKTVNLNLLLIISLLGMPLSVAFYFWTQYQNIKKLHVQIIVALWAITSIFIITPWVYTELKIISWYIWISLATVFFLYASYCAIKGVFMGRVGAITQLIAITVYIISIRTQWLPDSFYGHRNVQIGSLLYRYMLLFAYFQMIKSMQLDYKNLSQRVVKISDDIYSNLARELHDGIGQHLASMKLQTQLAKKESNNPYLLNLEQELKASLTGLRRLIAGLHPLLIDKYGISEALHKEVEHLKKAHKIEVSLNISKLKLSKNMEHQLFRIFQECTNNAIKHGHASKIDIKLYQEDGELSLKIQDDGAGFDAEIKPSIHKNRGFGFISLHERIALLNGQLMINSKKNKGTNIFIQIPINGEDL